MPYIQPLKHMYKNKYSCTQAHTHLLTHSHIQTHSHRHTHKKNLIPHHYIFILFCDCPETEPTIHIFTLRPALAVETKSRTNIHSIHKTAVNKATAMSMTL